MTADLNGCLEAKLIEVGEYGGGSFGWHFSYGIYAYSKLPNQRKILLPLRYFPTKNDAVNYLHRYGHCFNKCALALT